MKTLYQIIREFYGENKEDYKQVVYTETVYESKQDAESVLLDGLKVKLVEQGWEFRITEVNLFEEVKTNLSFENYKYWLMSVTDKVTYKNSATLDKFNRLSVSEKDSISDIVKRWNAESEVVRKRILADNAIKIEDDELDNNKPCGCEADKICLMCFDE